MGSSFTEGPTTTRRELVGTVGTGAGALAGCAERERSEIETAETTVESQSTTERRITAQEQVSHYRNIVTSQGHVIDPAEFSDWGKAINAAYSTLVTAEKARAGEMRGVIYLPETEGVEQFSTPVGFRSGFQLVGQGGGNTPQFGQENGTIATNLEYTGSGFAFKDVAGASATRGIRIQNLRCDVSNADANGLFYGYILKDSWFVNVISEGPAAANTSGFEIHSDTGRSLGQRWYNCSVDHFDVNVHYVDDEGGDGIAAMQRYYNCSSRTNQTNEGHVVSGPVEDLMWFGGDCHNATVAFDFTEVESDGVVPGDINLYGMRVESTDFVYDLGAAGTGVDGSNGYVNIYGGKQNPGTGNVFAHDDADGVAIVYGAQGSGFPNAIDIPTGENLNVGGTLTGRTVEVRRGVDLGNSASLGGLLEYTDDSSPSNNELYFDSTDGQLEYKDSTGTIHDLG